MTKAKSKRKTTSRTNSSKTKGRNSTARTAPNLTKLKAGTHPADDTRAQSSAQQNENTDSKQSRIVAMLRTPKGATVESIAHAMGWQHHSVRGFLAGVVRKKLGLNLVSAAAEIGRIYRIIDKMPSSGATAKSVKAM